MGDAFRPGLDRNDAQLDAIEQPSNVQHFLQAHFPLYGSRPHNDQRPEDLSYFNRLQASIPENGLMIKNFYKNQHLLIKAEPTCFYFAVGRRNFFYRDSVAAECCESMVGEVKRLYALGRDGDDPTKWWRYLEGETDKFIGLGAKSVTSLPSKLWLAVLVQNMPNRKNTVELKARLKALVKSELPDLETFAQQRKLGRLLEQSSRTTSVDVEPQTSKRFLHLSFKPRQEAKPLLPSDFDPHLVDYIKQLTLEDEAPSTTNQLPKRPSPTN